MNTLKSPAGENILLAASRALEQNKTTSQEDLVANYDRIFKSSVAEPLDNSHVFERFSLIDPNIRLTIQSHTSTL
ncbi:hypothetical protein [Ferrovum sp.]|jgi:hypothetical protein|uniref:hypothetical protein n=1 Tax=Ferrovum sp. TaxID=2609467 RepID=UPI002633AF3E|nr:hypothetical protein [Ferrovum sp.]